MSDGISRYEDQGRHAARSATRAAVQGAQSIDNPPPVGGENLWLARQISTLLETGGAVWLINIVAFALLYWEFDCGGPAARAHGMPPSPDFAFPQQLNPEVSPPQWSPRFVDYLYLGITDAVAFSPTDAMPLVPWAKLAMSIEAVISLMILGLVIARAVNVFT